MILEVKSSSLIYGYNILMKEVSYTIPVSLNFKRMKSEMGRSTTLETRSKGANQFAESLAKFRSHGEFLNHQLYRQYSSSQNYYYLKDVNAILADQRTRTNICHHSLADQINSSGSLKRLYKAKEYRGKLEKLVDYYKFHKEIPRMFSESIYDLFFDYHDRKRKCEYILITNDLKKNTPEDPQAAQEEYLRRERAVKYVPFLKGLGPAPEKFQRGGEGDSLYSMQARLNLLVNSQVSNLSMESLRGDLEARKFESYLIKNGNVNTINAKAANVPAKQSPFNMMKVGVQGQVLKPNAHIVSLEKNIVSTLKKINLDGHKKEEGGVVRFPRSPVDSKPSSTHFEFKIQARKDKPAAFGKAENTHRAIEPSLRDPTHRVVESSEPKRQPVSTARTTQHQRTLSHSNTNHVQANPTGMKKESATSSRKEFSDFRIMNKQGSSGRSHEAIPIVKQASATKFNFSKKLSMGADVVSSIRSKPMEDRFFGKGDPSKSKTLTENENYILNVKMDIEKILKTTTQTVSQTGLTAGRSVKMNSTARTGFHKYAKSGPEELTKFMVRDRESSASKLPNKQLGDAVLSVRGSHNLEGLITKPALAANEGYVRKEMENMKGSRVKLMKKSKPSHKFF